MLRTPSIPYPYLDLLLFLFPSYLILSRTILSRPHLISLTLHSGHYDSLPFFRAATWLRYLLIGL